MKNLIKDVFDIIELIFESILLAACLLSCIFLLYNFFSEQV